MARLTRIEAEVVVNTILSQYGSIVVSKDHHFEKIAAVYGEIMEGQPVDEQFADQGALIAVLFWRCAELQGNIREPEGSKA